MPNCYGSKRKTKSVALCVEVKEFSSLQGVLSFYLAGKFKALNTHHHIYSPTNIQTYILGLPSCYYQLSLLLFKGRFSTEVQDPIPLSYSRILLMQSFSYISKILSSWIKPINIQTGHYLYLKKIVLIPSPL